jgi:hypothetical protein
MGERMNRTVHCVDVSNIKLSGAFYYLCSVLSFSGASGSAGIDEGS